ncbi:MAG: hypothetical protein EXR79_00235 [Myxococcales bacterium]|nr:hypothetical protein [Myxococcales bacterium]
MVGTLGQVGGRRRRMMGELFKADLGGSARSMMKSLSYGASRAVVAPDANRPAQDDRHLVMEKWVQAALNVVLGMNLKLDGVLRGESRAALQRFQRSRGLNTHGFVDEETLLALELEVGVRAPRDGTYQPTVPPVWMEDRRKPAPPPAQPPAKNAPDAKERLADGAAAGSPAHRPAPARTPDEQRAEAAADMLRREAEQAAVARAFGRSFVDDELDRLGQHGDAALHLTMQRWFEALRATGDLAPRWLTDALGMARERPVEAVAKIQAAWTAAHPRAAKAERDV